MSKQDNLALVIMAGGGGTRFWPLSKQTKPKQFLNLLGQRSLLQETFERIKKLLPSERIFVLTNKNHLPLTRESLPQLPQENIIGEPYLRDTAAAVALGATIVQKQYPGSTMIVLPADHHIPESDKFCHDLLSAAKGAKATKSLYTIGISPSYAATGYGYLEQGEVVKNLTGHSQLKRFIEKPNLDKAKEYVASNNFFWNAGIFIWQTKDILAEIKRQLPEHAKNIFPLADYWGKKNWDEQLAKAFNSLKKISIDFGVMENAKRVNMLEANFAWDDVGGFLALEKYLDKDKNGNRHNGKIASLNAENNLTYSEDAEETIALIGVKDLVVVRAGKKTLITNKKDAESIKKLVETVLPEDER